MSALVIGLDLSLAATGWADDDHQGVIRSGSDKPLEERLDTLRHEVYLLVRYGCDLIVIEDLPRMVAHGGPQLGMVHGVVRWSLKQWGRPFLLVPPATLKVYATGRGNATKADIRVELLKRYDVDIRDDNAADAFVLRAIGMEVLGEPVVALPQTHRRALAKLEWDGFTYTAAAS